MKPLKYGFAKQARQHIKARIYFTAFKVSAVNIFDKQKNPNESFDSSEP